MKHCLIKNHNVWKFMGLVLVPNQLEPWQWIEINCPSALLLSTQPNYALHKYDASVVGTTTTIIPIQYSVLIQFQSPPITEPTATDNQKLAIFVIIGHFGGHLRSSLQLFINSNTYSFTTNSSHSMLIPQCCKIDERQNNKDPSNRKQKSSQF